MALDPTLARTSATVGRRMNDQIRARRIHRLSEPSNQGAVAVRPLSGYRELIARADRDHSDGGMPPERGDPQPCCWYSNMGGWMTHVAHIAYRLSISL
jgi:hypothetical protein